MDGISPTEDPDRYNAIIGQEKYDAGFTMDFYTSKSFKFGKHYIRMSVGINNLLDNTDFRTGGFEQLRFDFDGKDPQRFAPRYFYAFGRTYFIGISYSL